MVQTRAQNKATDTADHGSKSSAEEIPKKRKHEKPERAKAVKGPHPNKRTRIEGHHHPTATQSTSGASDRKSQSFETNTGQSSCPRIEFVLQKYGSVPLSDTELEEPLSPKPETIMALLLNALFSSTRISHELAAKTTATVIKANYHEIERLRRSSWLERTQVLTEGGYTRYREKTATGLGELVELVDTKYNGDLNNLLPNTRADSSPDEIRLRLKEIKGLGDVGVDIFIDTAQAVWPCLAPFLDPRSAKTAEAVGIPSEVQTLWSTEEIGRDPVKMCKLASALTTIRLDKREEEFLRTNN